MKHIWSISDRQKKGAPKICSSFLILWAETQSRYFLYSVPNSSFQFIALPNLSDEAIPIPFPLEDFKLILVEVRYDHMIFV